MNDNKLNFFKENIKRKYCTLGEEVVNPGNQPMTKGEITKRDRIAKKTKPRPIKGDTPAESRHRIATWITLRNKKKKGKD